MRRFFATAMVLVVPILAMGQDLSGSYVLVPQSSSDIDRLGALKLEIEVRSDYDVTLISTWGRGRRSFSDTLAVAPGSAARVPIASQTFPSNITMGLKKTVGDEQELSSKWLSDGRGLEITESYEVLSSQGKTPISVIHRIQLGDEPGILHYSIDRSTREETISYVLKREGSRNAFYYEFEDNWHIDEMLPSHAMVISLQGLANEEAPNLYFVYPETWDFRFTPDVLDFYTDKKYYTFKELNTVEQVFDQFKEHAEGYVVWDQNERTSLIVAYTIAGLERAVVVTEELIPMVEEAGLRRVEDLRGTFDGMEDVDIYRWAYDRYWDRTNKDYIVWLGGHYGKIMKPGVADFAMKKRMFFTDLSANPEDTEEYEYAKKLLSELNPNAIVMGWHSYGKDTEGQHVTLTSSYGHRVEGLHTLPNMSFSEQIPVTPGFEFKNNHNVEPGQTFEVEEKVYISVIQTDCLGLGAWNRPGRGDIPYAWEVTMNWVWMAPAMMEFFYSQATPNDYFIGALSGPGYMYPKAIPDELRPPLIAEARRLMKILDLRVFEIMDYSELRRDYSSLTARQANRDLTKDVIDDYYEGMPDVIGFVNGYMPAFTHLVRDGRPMISYDYYMSQTRPVEQCAEDLIELANVNTERPYFLLMHVRQWSDITRVKDVLDRLGPEFELVPLDVFLTMAGQQPTYEEMWLE